MNRSPVAKAGAMPDNPRAVISVPSSLRRRAAEIEGWLDLDCPEKALSRLTPLFETPGARPAALYLRVRARIALRQYPDALADLHEIRAFDPDPEWLDLNEAWCQKRLGRLDDAVRCMERLVARSGRSAIGHFNLGCYLALLGQHKRAIDEVTRACGLDEKFRRLAAAESDLDSLRGDPEFDALLA